MKQLTTSSSPAARVAPSCAGAVTVAVFLALLLFLVGCVSTSERSTTEVTAVGSAPSDAEPGSTPESTPDAQPPSQINTLAGHLMTYHARQGRLPPSLDALGEEAIMPQAEHAALPDYAYHPGGLGVLPDGRRVLLVDAAIRVPGYVWCIVQQPEDDRAGSRIEVTLVPIAQLEAAAEASNADVAQ